MNVSYVIGMPQEDAPCELCGKVAELRPYGPNDENVCFECGMKDEEAAKRKFFQQLDQHLFPGNLRPGQQN